MAYAVRRSIVRQIRAGGWLGWRTGVLETLPVTQGPLKVAVGWRDGWSSNSWRIWVHRSGIYVACRENIRFHKVSLHASGRWRVAVTAQAAAAGCEIPGGGADRAFEVWDEPAPQVGGVVRAYQLLFPLSELHFPLEERESKHWRDVLFVTPAASRIDMLTLGVFVGPPDVAINIDGVQHMLLAKWALDDGRACSVVAHDAEFFQIAELVRIVRAELPEEQRTEEHHMYVYSEFEDKSRFVVSFSAVPRIRVAGSASDRPARHQV